MNRRQRKRRDDRRKAHNGAARTTAERRKIQLGYIEKLPGMTVPALLDLGRSMNLIIPTKTRKGDIVDIIADELRNRAAGKAKL